MNAIKFVYKGIEVFEKDFTDELKVLYGDFVKVENELKALEQEIKVKVEAHTKAQGKMEYLQGKVNPILEKITAKRDVSESISKW